jgi:chromosome segregation ATPase
MKQQISLVSVEYRNALINVLRKYKIRCGKISHMRAANLIALEEIIKDEKYTRNSELTDAVKQYIAHELKTGFLLFSVKKWRVNTGRSMLKQSISRTLEDNPATKLVESEIDLLMGLLASTEGLEKEALREELAKSQQELARTQAELIVARSEQRSMGIEMRNIKEREAHLTSELKKATGKIGELERRFSVVERELTAKVDKLSRQTEELLVERLGSEHHVGEAEKSADHSHKLRSRAFF